MKLGILSLLALLASSSTLIAQEYLVRFNSDNADAQKNFFKQQGGRFELVSKEGQLYKWTTSSVLDSEAILDSNVAYISKNQELHIFQSPSLLENRAAILKTLSERNLSLDGNAYPDNPEIQNPNIQASGLDTLLEKSWGMFSIDAVTAFKKTPQGKGVVVAVTDTGIDYNHPDLINNVWRNKGEIAGNNIDDDKNGYVDDLVGWDFYSNDSKPYDLSMDLMDILLKGGNPGHGTHVSGVIGASLNNSQGTAGVAPQVKIMGLRFIGETGKGSTDSAVKAIDYAAANGANIINASWGGEAGEEDDKPLREAIQRAEKKGVLFIVAAGNGRLNPATQQAEGFDNDNDKKPVVPSSYDYPNMISVSAIDSETNLAAFSNWGHKSTKVGAPGVKIMSTVPGNRYQDTVVDLGSIKATWDGTSMATPFVVGAAAVVWSQDLTQTAQAVKEKLLSLSTLTDSLKGKVATEGRLDLHGIH